MPGVGATLPLSPDGWHCPTRGDSGDMKAAMGGPEAAATLRYGQSSGMDGDGPTGMQVGSSSSALPPGPGAWGKDLQFKRQSPSSRAKTFPLT